MIDPNDTDTLDLVEACRQPLSGAVRAKRLRDKRRAERKAGARATLDLKADDLGVVFVALDEFTIRWRDNPNKVERARTVLSRLPSVQYSKVFPGDPRQVDVVGQVEWDFARPEAVQPVLLSLDDLIFIWSCIDDSLTVRGAHDTLKMAQIREMLTRMFHGLPWVEQGCIDTLGQCPVLIEREKHRNSESRRGWKAYKDECKATSQYANQLREARADLAGAKAEITGLQAVVRELQATIKEIGAAVGGDLPPAAPKDDSAELRRRITALEKEHDLLESERNKAFVVNRTLTERLGRAGLCTDYRPQPGER